jgi:hypothetical protein
MRESIRVVTIAMAAAIATAGLGVGLSLGLASAQASTTAGTGTGTGTVTGASLAAGPRAAASECGRSCFILYSRRNGVSTSMNAVIPRDDGSGGKVGRKLNLRSAAARTADGDFSFSFISRVWQFCGTDSHDFFAPGSYICHHNSSFAVFEAEWSPYGNSTDLCAGVAVANRPWENITLRPCGVSDHTLWIANLANRVGNSCRGSDNYCPWMNASDNNFRAPLVLTLDSSTRSPADQLMLSPEQLLPDGSSERAWNNQEFAFLWHSGI